MSAGGSGESNESIPQTQLMIVGLVGGLVGTYGAYFLSGPTGGALSVLGGIGAVCATVWSAAAVRKVASYGLGTGVPSIGMLALGMGIVATMFALSVGGILGPIVAVVIAAIIGYLMGVFANKVLKMNIPVMVQSMTEIAVSSTLLLMGYCTLMTGTFDFPIVLEKIVSPGYIALFYIAGGMAVLHPYNANLGPDEKQDRTLWCAVEKSGIVFLISGIIASWSYSPLAGATSIISGLLIWYFGFNKYYGTVKRDAYKIVGTGLLPSEEEL